MFISVPAIVSQWVEVGRWQLLQEMMRLAIIVSKI